jgi:conjugative relaxase-like TrwC/TraI family protein
LGYYTQLQDYYLTSEAAAGQEVAHWLGEGARRLDLEGAVSRAEFEQLLLGRLPDGTQLGTFRDGQLEHRPSWDLTFSAPKSVSVMALVGEDTRLISAHDQAVRAALSYVESNIAETRIREKGVVTNETTGNLIIVSLREDTSRAGDPQLHSHNVVMNATQSSDGQWRSIDGYRFFQAQREIGQIYRNELALRCQELGYEVMRGKEGVFELAAVPAAVIREFSARSAAIEQALAGKGLTRETATSGEKDVATLQTRMRKSEVAADQLRDGWVERASGLGFDTHAFLKLARAHSFEFTGGRNDAAAALAVESATAKLAEREAVFSARSLRLEAMQMSVGQARLSDVERAIEKARNRGFLISRQLFQDGRLQSGYTTREGIQTETRMLAAELAGRHSVSPLLSGEAVHRAVAQAELRSGMTWTIGQRLATAAILASSNQVEALQGYAGTAKTTTVVRTFAQVASRQGYDIVPLAPTASAAETLGAAIDRKSVTVSRHLLQLGRISGVESDPNGSRQIWVVDEASMLSARQTTQLLDAARESGARVLLIGDVQQLGSIDAGAAFRQLQSAGMRTSVLDEIVRQSNVGALEAVYAAIQGDAKAALAAIERGGGRVLELSDQVDRHSAIASDYAAFSPAQRASTLLLDASREGREQLTDAVRELLKQDRTLSGPSIRVDTLEDKRLTREDAKQAFNYEAGDRVRFRQTYAAGARKGEYYRVSAVDVLAGVVNLTDAAGKSVEWMPAKWGASTAEAYCIISRELMAGDQIAWTRNDQRLGRVNGHVAQVVSINLDGTAAIRDKGGTRTVDFIQETNQHFRHAYVSTVHAAQGRTADRVLVNAESFRTNLLNERSFYVSISRARSEIRVYTDDRKELIRAIEERTGEKATALREGGIVSRESAAHDKSALGERDIGSRSSTDSYPRANSQEATARNADRGSERQ